MKLLLERIAYKETYTVGKLYIDGVYECDTLEHPIRDKKIKGITAIPAGKYKVVITYSPRFNKMMPLLLNVPGFDGIRIHTGNTVSDSSGCILIGQNKIKGKLINSRMTYDLFMKKLDNNIEIEIK